MSNRPNVRAFNGKDEGKYPGRVMVQMPSVYENNAAMKGALEAAGAKFLLKDVKKNEKTGRDFRSTVFILPEGATLDDTKTKAIVDAGAVLQAASAARRTEQTDKPAKGEAAPKRERTPEEKAAQAEKSRERAIANDSNRAVFKAVEAPAVGDKVAIGGKKTAVTRLGAEFTASAGLIERFPTAGLKEGDAVVFAYGDAPAAGKDATAPATGKKTKAAPPPEPDDLGLDDDDIPDHDDVPF